MTQIVMQIFLLSNKNNEKLPWFKICFRIFTWVIAIICKFKLFELLSPLYQFFVHFLFKFLFIFFQFFVQFFVQVVHALITTSPIFCSIFCSCSYHHFTNFCSIFCSSFLFIFLFNFLWLMIFNNSVLQNWFCVMRLHAM